MKKFFQFILRSRIFILLAVIVVLFAILVQHLYVMQIINGSKYQTDFTASIEKTISSDGIRGKIYDCNGTLLAYNRRTYKITLEDTGTYEAEGEKTASEVKNEKLNREIDRLITLIEKNGDTITNNFGISMNRKTRALSFNVSGTRLNRFRADVFGRKKASDLQKNESAGLDERTATARQIYDYLAGNFGLSDDDDYAPYRRYQILSIRYALSLNNYQKYITTTVASDVSEKTVADVNEYSDELQGTDVAQTTRRVYTYPEYFSGIIGYTGTVSTDEYEELSEEDDSYTLSDQVGKAGIERLFESQLRGKKGETKVYVNNVGKIQEVVSESAARSGNDIYLSLDADLQKAVYKLLEQEIAGILKNSLKNVKTYETKTKKKTDVYTPVYDVYTALITNSVLNADKLPRAKDGTAQARIYSAFQDSQETMIARVRRQLQADTVYSGLSDGMKEIVTYIVRQLQADGIFDSNAVSSSDRTYLSWKNGEISVKDYLKHAINEGWIDITSLNLKSSYADTDELYQALISYTVNKIRSDSGFDKIIYKYLILDDRIAPGDVCLALYEQGILKEDGQYEKLKNGSLAPFDFIRSKINDLEITPGELGLNPCSGSCVLTDPKTGQLLACVSYPGYNSNRLANGVDSDYYNSLAGSTSLPLYNYATQQVTAPGSTFKMVSGIAGLEDHVITPDTLIEDKGIFKKVGMNLRCWIYPGSHGKENFVHALRDSCNYYFSEVGYRLSKKDGKYDEETGISRISSCASSFGLGEKTGVEIAENTGQTATELPVSAAIGQSNHSFTTIQLSRYVTAIANRGTVYQYTLLSKITDADGKTIKSYKPKVKNQITDVSDSTWNAVTMGMKEVVANHKQFNSISSVKLAGKTGTAQESSGKPNHALFVGFAPYDDPEISIAVRIAYGYSSSNACDLAAKVMKYYYHLENRKKLLNADAADGTAGNSVND